MPNLEPINVLCKNRNSSIFLLLRCLGVRSPVSLSLAWLDPFLTALYWAVHQCHMCRGCPSPIVSMCGWLGVYHSICNTEVYFSTMILVMSVESRGPWSWQPGKCPFVTGAWTSGDILSWVIWGLCQRAMAKSPLFWPVLSIYSASSDWGQNLQKGLSKGGNSKKHERCRDGWRHGIRFR